MSTGSEVSPELTTGVIIKGEIDNDKFADFVCYNSEKREAFVKDLSSVINKHSLDNIFAMPDFILADMMLTQMEGVGFGLIKRQDWMKS